VRLRVIIVSDKNKKRVKLYEIQRRQTISISEFSKQYGLRVVHSCVLYTYEITHFKISRDSVAEFAGSWNTHSRNRLILIRIILYRVVDLTQFANRSDLLS